MCIRDRNDARKLCPSGWKVPNALDATSLQVELGGPSIDGTAALLALPQDPITGLDYLPYADGTNNFGFNGVPLNGMQEAGAMLYGSLNNGMLWGHESSAYGYTTLGGGFSINTGYSVAYPVRCVKSRTTTEAAPMPITSSLNRPLWWRTGRA